MQLRSSELLLVLLGDDGCHCQNGDNTHFDVQGVLIYSIQSARTSNLDDLYGLDATAVSVLDICHYLLLSQSRIQYISSSFYARDQMDRPSHRECDIDLYILQKGFKKKNKGNRTRRIVRDI